MLSALFLLSNAFAAPSADAVTSLPGLTGPTSSQQYSGYLDIAGGKHLHYWLVESENNPKTDPVVFWFNGGPGCSSLDGYFYEQGPYHIVEPYPTNGSVPTLYLNPYRWNLVANMVFLESPAGVGFSYADEASGYSNSDTQQAVDSFNALQFFYTQFPEYAQNDLFLSGESYGGMYVPTLALQILSYNSNNPASSLPLRGIAVGNGVIGQGTGQPSEQFEIDFMYGHGLFSTVTYDKIVQNCNTIYSQVRKKVAPGSEVDCLDALVDMNAEVGQVNVYDIYEPCINDYATRSYSRRPPTALQRKVTEAIEATGRVGSQGLAECINGGAAAAYLNILSVQQAIHVKTDLPWAWAVCGGPLSYSENWGSLLPDYANTLVPADMSVLIYNGDVDGCIPYIGNEWWTSGLGVPVEAPWHPWQTDGQVSGYATAYQNNFTFVTVKGAGHMVPQYAPPQALDMFTRFITNAKF